MRSDCQSQPEDVKGPNRDCSGRKLELRFNGDISCYSASVSFFHLPFLTWCDFILGTGYFILLFHFFWTVFSTKSKKKNRRFMINHCNGNNNEINHFISVPLVFCLECVQPPTILTHSQTDLRWGKR